MTRASPLRKIDSLSDASMAYNLTLLTTEDSNLMGYLHSEKDDPMAQRLLNKIELHGESSWLNETFRVDVLNKLKSGSFALVHNKLTAIFLLYVLSELRENKISNEDILDVIHVASDGGGYLPTFLSVNQDNNAFSLNDFNVM